WDVVQSGGSAECMGLTVVEFQEHALLAPHAVPADEGAAATVAAPAPTLDGVRDVTRPDHRRPGLLREPGRIRPAADRTARPGGGGELGFLDLLEKQAQGTLDDDARIAVRNLAAEKSLEAPERLVA